MIQFVTHRARELSAVEELFGVAGGLQLAQVRRLQVVVDCGFLSLVRLVLLQRRLVALQVGEVLRQGVLRRLQLV